MGNYNCQECITKEANLINELLLDSNLLYSEEASIEESKTHESKIRTKKSNKHQPSQEDLKKLLDKKNLSKEQKKFVEKIINKDSEIPDIKITNLEPVENNNNDAIIIQNSESPKNRNEKLELTHDENEETLKSKKFKIETYEPLSNNNDNYNMDYLFEKSDRGDEPQDSMRPDFRKPIIPKGNKNNSNKNLINNNKILGPRDSLRKSNNTDINENNNNSNNSNSNNNKMPMNRGEINDINNNNNKINIKETNKMQINNNNNKINNNTPVNKKFLSPYNKQQLYIEPTDNNKLPNNNNSYKERKVITSGPYLNQVEELKNAYTSGNVINSINTREKNEKAIYQGSSQRDMEITISERESTLPLYDDKCGNMNYLEKQYQAYQNKKRQFYDDENF